MKSCFFGKRISALVFLFMLLIVLMHACTNGSSLPDRELEGIAQLDDGYCSVDPFCQDLEFQKEGKLLFLESGDEGKFVVIAPGRMKLSIGEETLVLGYTLSDKKLELKFEDYRQVYYYSNEREENVAQLGQSTDTEQNFIQPNQPTVILPTTSQSEVESTNVQDSVEVRFTLSYTLDANETLEKNAHYRMELADGTLGSAHMVKQEPNLTDIEFSRDGTLLVASAGDAGIIVWDLITGSIITDITGRSMHTKVNSGGEYLVVETSYCSPIVLKSHSLEYVRSIEGGVCTTLIDIHPIEDIVSVNVSTEGGVLFELLTGNKVDVIPDCYQPYFSSDGQNIFCFPGDNSIEVWDYQTRERLSSFKLGVPILYQSLSISPIDNKIAFSCNETGSILLYDLVMNESIQLAQFSSSDPVYRTSFSGDGRLIAASDSKKVYIWDVASAKLIFEINQSDDRFGEISFIPGTRQLAIKYPKRIEVWSEN